MRASRETPPVVQMGWDAECEVLGDRRRRLAERQLQDQLRDAALVEAKGASTRHITRLNLQLQLLPTITPIFSPSLSSTAHALTLPIPARTGGSPYMRSILPSKSCSTITATVLHRCRCRCRPGSPRSPLAGPTCAPTVSRTTSPGLLDCTFNIAFSPCRTLYSITLSHEAMPDAPLGRMSNSGGWAVAQTAFSLRSSRWHLAGRPA